MAPRNSDITVTDQFCGAGGSSIGATRAGLRVRLAMNHWKLAIETHNTNFPDTDHDCTDVSAADPRRYPSTDILITSPECTTHSPAGGSRRSKPQRDMFKPQTEDAATVRSRATMWDVPRFCEYHRYNAIIVENVVEVTRWELFPTWLQAMEILGYEHRIVSLNSMFAHPTPQSRDRIYIVFWRKGNRVPRLDFTASAPCGRCGQAVEARQTFKNGRRVGKYRQQYIFTCPTCRGEVLPYYYAALNALDLSLPAERIGDRQRPLRPRTLERIRYGLQKFGRQALVVRTNMTTNGGRVRSVLEAMQTQTASWLDSLVAPPGFVIETGFSNAPERRPRGLDEAAGSQTARQSAALVALPFMVAAGSRETRARAADDAVPTLTGSQRLAVAIPFRVGLSNAHGHGHLVRAVDDAHPTQTTVEDGALVIPPHAILPQHDNEPRTGDDPLPTMTTGAETNGVALPPMFFATLRTNSKAHPADGALSTVSAQGGHHGVVLPPAALLTLRGETTRDGGARGLEAPLSAQVASSAQDWLLQRAPFLLGYQKGNPVGLDGATPTVTTIERHMLVGPDEELRVEDCFFRMLQPHEIGRAMAFPDSYTVLGNKRDRVKQYGNAVTPPAMSWLIDRVVESLAPEVAV